MRCLSPLLLLLPPVPAAAETATFAGGCFWRLAAVYRTTRGVSSVAVGYTGGWSPSPSQAAVASGVTGHAEAVQLAFDPATVSYSDLLHQFWRSHEPWKRGAQGKDVGSQFRSVVFTHGHEQAAVVQRHLSALRANATVFYPQLSADALAGDKLSTEVQEAGEFFTPKSPAFHCATAPGEQRPAGAEDAPRVEYVPDDDTPADARRHGEGAAAYGAGGWSWRGDIGPLADYYRTTPSVLNDSMAPVAAAGYPAAERCSMTARGAAALRTGYLGETSFVKENCGAGGCTWKEASGQSLGPLCGDGDSRPTPSEAKADCERTSCCKGVTCTADGAGIDRRLWRDPAACPAPTSSGPSGVAGFVASVTHMVTGPLGGALDAAGLPVVLHRKWWEVGAVLLALDAAGVAGSGRRGLCVGCGNEFLPSVLAARGVSVVATDQPKQGAWQRSEFTHSAQALHYADIVPADVFEKMVSVRALDMLSPDEFIRDNNRSFDFLWSVSAVEHLGSSDVATGFIAAAMSLLRPGGVAVHVSELNIDAASPDDECGQAGFMLWTRRSLAGVRERLARDGHDVRPLHLCLPSVRAESTFDRPPFAGEGLSLGDWLKTPNKWPSWRTPHFKLHRCRAFTSFSMVARAGGV